MLGSYSHVIVDEAQDMNKAQLILAQLLLAEGGRLIYVGDPLQAIYGFRGAYSSALDDFAKEHGATVLPLNVTYRCPQSIVKLAQKYAPDFTAAPEAPEGEVFSNTTERHMLEQAGPGDFILCRANAPLMGICLKLLAQGKRAYMAGRDVGQELLGILRKMRGNKAFSDMADLEARIARWQQIETEKAYRACKSPEAAERRVEGIDDKANIFHALAEGLEDLQEVEGALNRLFCDPEKTSKDFICCSTVHRSKGLEADNVFILAQGFNRAGEEENHIRYVAITRAKKRLYGVGFAFEGDSPDGGAEAPEEAFRCQGCGREEGVCSASPCPAVLDDRAEGAESGF